MNSFFAYVIVEIAGLAVVLALVRFIYFRILRSRIPKMVTELACPNCGGTLTLSSQSASIPDDRIKTSWRGPSVVSAQCVECRECKNSFTYNLTSDGILVPGTSQWLKAP